MKETVQIGINKKRLILPLLASIMFVAGGIWLLTKENPDKDPRVPLAIAVFAISTVVYLVRLANTRPALIVNEDGIYDSSSYYAVKFIPWQDITGFKTERVYRNKFVIAMVNNPIDYRNNASSFFQRQSIKFNQRRYGSPIAIAASSLDMRVDNLVALLEERRKR